METQSNRNKTLLREYYIRVLKEFDIGNMSVILIKNN